MAPVAPESDFETFYEMARLIAQGHWWPDSYGWQFQGPGYPVVLAPVALLGDGLAAIRALNLALQVATLGCVWLLARSLLGRRQALAAVAIAAFFPGLWLYTPVVAAENLAMFLLTAIATILAWPNGRWRLVLLGVLVAYLAFARPAFLFFVPVVGVVVAFSKNRVSPRRLGWYALGLALVFFPILQANAAQGGPALPLANAGYQLWLIHNERAEGHWFPADESEDYPFKALVDGVPWGGAVAAAQQKLGLQFIVANPGKALEGIAVRHAINWSTDGQGLTWTAGRLPGEVVASPGNVNLLSNLTERYHAIVVALALLGVLLIRSPKVVVAIAVPLLYVLLIYLPAAAGDRLHTSVLPLLSVPAAAAIFSWHRGEYLFLSALLIIASQVFPSAEAIVIWPVALVPFSAQALAAIPRLKSELVRGRTRRFVVAGFAALLVLTTVGVVGSKAAIENTLAELAAVDPSGWQGHRATSDGVRATIPVSLVPSAVTGDVRKVSYPDAAAVRFASAPRPGEVISVSRTLSDLVPRNSYRFYLQVFDPGAMDDQLDVALNGRVVWKREPSRDAVAGWRYISVPWLADSSRLEISVEWRALGAGGARPGELLVRTLHLYPKF